MTEIRHSVIANAGFAPPAKPPANKGGRPADKRLAELDAIAVAWLAERQGCKPRDAAKHFLCDYRANCKELESDQKNMALRDITKRIEKLTALPIGC